MLDFLINSALLVLTLVLGPFLFAAVSVAPLGIVLWAKNIRVARRQCVILKLRMFFALAWLKLIVTIRGHRRGDID